MALGARCYQYIKVDQETALPVGDELTWVKDDLAPFFEMVSEVQPYLENATPTSDVGILFSENTRYRFPYYDRKTYMQVCEAITNNYLKASMPVEYINVLDLEKKDLSKLRMLVLPYTSGLTPSELEAVKQYVNNGGNLVVMGDALLYNEQGEQNADFALAKAMGVQFVGNVTTDNDFSVTYGGTSEKITDLTQVRPTDGKTLEWLTHNGQKIPLVHLNDWGKGKVMYIASASAETVLRNATDHYFGELPIHVENGKQVVLTHQPDLDRWILHLIDEGDYQIRIKRDFAAFGKIDATFPDSSHLQTDIKSDGTDWLITVKGDLADRLLVLK